MSRGGGVRVFVLAPRRPGPLLPPEALPLGRAALQLREQGIEVVFGEETRAGARVAGWSAAPGGWRAVHDLPVDAVYDRFPSQGRPAAFAAALADLASVPVGNAPSLTALCVDKVASQRFLSLRGVAMPPLEAHPERFEERLAEWGAAYRKPRAGSFGEGVVLLGSAGGSAAGGWPADAVLQRAVAPPALRGRPLQGLGVRVLVQREADGGWTATPAVARYSYDDPVANGARGARLAPLIDLWGADVAREAEAVGLSAALALAEHEDGDHLLEVGVDVVLDGALRPWVIEVNGKPRGRFAQLGSEAPERFGELAAAVNLRPLARLAQLARATTPSATPPLEPPTQRRGSRGGS